MSRRYLAVRLSAGVMLWSACGAAPATEPFAPTTAQREVECATSGLIPLDRVNVADDAEFQAQLGMRFNTPLRGEYVALLEKRLVAVPIDEDAANELARVMDQAQQWDRALEVLRHFEGARDAAPPGTIRLARSPDPTSRLARQISSHGNTTEWRRRLVRDSVAEGGDVDTMMGNIAALLELQPGEYSECEAMVVMDRDVHASTSSMPLTHIAPPVRYAKRPLLGALNGYMWTRAQALQRLPDDALALRVHATGLPPGVTSDDGHGRGIWSFADGSARVLELDALSGDQRLGNTNWADNVRVGRVEIEFAIRDSGLQTYRPLGRLQGELTADELVVTDVSRELVSALADLSRITP